MTGYDENRELIKSLWPMRHNGHAMTRKLLRAAIADAQRWRQRFRKLPTIG